MSSQYYFNTNDSRSYQSTAGFNRHQPYSPSPQVRASVRVIGSQDQYPLTNSPHLVQISPQQHHFQFDSRQQSGRPTGPAVVYQTPGAAQFTHRNVDLWTEGSSPNYQPPPPQDHFVHVEEKTNLFFTIDSLLFCSLGSTCLRSIGSHGLTATISFSLSATLVILQSITTGYLSLDDK